MRLVVQLDGFPGEEQDSWICRTLDGRVGHVPVHTRLVDKRRGWAFGGDIIWEGGLWLELDVDHSREHGRSVIEAHRVCVTGVTHLVDFTIYSITSCRKLSPVELIVLLVD